MTTTIMDKISELETKLRAMEERFYEMGGDMRASVQSEVKKKWKIPAQSETYFGLYLAICVDTLDRDKQNRVRFFSPLFNDPDVPYTSLDWAYPVSSMGGFDDSGLNWVPPAGSLLCILFSRGYRSAPFYIGTTWTRSRGANGEYLKKYKDLQEYWLLHDGHRKGYLVGNDDESQVFPPWNTDNYQGFDLDSVNETEDVINAQLKNMTYPHQYGFKTPQKHMFKADDGDYKCNHRWKRMELQSSCGNYMIFKDDHLHAACQWAHPQCKCDQPGSIDDPCHWTWVSGEGKTLGFKAKEDPYSCSKESLTPQCANKYFKHENECRPCKGPQTRQNNNITNDPFGLQQSGFAVLSISGHYFGMSDQVEQPRGKPEWERSKEAFDYGCTDKYEGKTWWTSSTGHRIEMNDWEEPKYVRGWVEDDGFKGNYIRLLSACGNMVELNDHTVSECTAGKRRGITIRSTSGMLFRMSDEGNTQCSQQRQEMMDGTKPKDPDKRPISNAKKGFIQIRSGYGLEMLFRDDNSQQETDKQYIQFLAPQRDNTERGPHILRFQETKSGNGTVFMRVGGDYIIYTYDNLYTIVGNPLPKDKVTVVSRNNIELTQQTYVNIADLHVLMANRYIILMAGKDCGESGAQGPCIGRVLVQTPRGIVYSDRVFASYSNNSQCAMLIHMWPFVQCKGDE